MLMVNESVETSCDRRRETRGESGQPPTRITPSTRNRLVRLAYRFVWNQDDAEDAVQDALLTAETKADHLREDQNWWSWIRRIVVNRCHERGRKTQTRNRHEENLSVQHAGRIAAETRSDASHDSLDAVRTALLDLPRRQREVLVLLHLEGMPYDEIGRVLQMSPSTARVHAKAGRDGLRRILLQRFPDWFDRGGESDTGVS